ncbi:unnamed protein product (mitochondrion) [Musa textilis]
MLFQLLTKPEEPSINKQLNSIQTTTTVRPSRKTASCINTGESKSVNHLLQISVNHLLQISGRKEKPYCYIETSKASLEATRLKPREDQYEVGTAENSIFGSQTMSSSTMSKQGSQSSSILHTPMPFQKTHFSKSGGGLETRFDKVGLHFPVFLDYDF